MTAPCKDCPDRWASTEGNCHTDCDRYKAFAAYRRQIRERQQSDAPYVGYLITSKNKNDKKRRQKKGATK